MKRLDKLKKNFVINTKYFKNQEFNEPVYLINSNKEFFEVYSIIKNIVKIKKVLLKDELQDKTFITVKEFFKHCKKDNSIYSIEKVDNGDVYIRVAYFNDLSLFFRLREKNNIFILTNINKYKFKKENIDTLKKLYSVKYLNQFSALQINDYLSNLKNIKRDYLFSLKQSLENLQKQYLRQKTR